MLNLYFLSFLIVLPLIPNKRPFKSSICLQDLGITQGIVLIHFQAACFPDIVAVFTFMSFELHDKRL